MAEWFEEAFRDEYLQLYAHRGDLEADAEVRAWLGRVPGLSGDARVLDLACGAGRHLRAMQGQGLRATGLDLSENLLEEAVRKGTDRLVRGDMRRLPFRRSAFQAITSFFASFGYFRDEGDDVITLREMARILAPGGGLLLDLMDPESTRRDLVASSERGVGDWWVREERALVEGGRRVEKRIWFGNTEREPSWVESVRLYHPVELETLARAEGLEPIGRFGNHGTEPWRSGATPRCVLVFRRGPA